jgi:hypothetical protein
MSMKKSAMLMSAIAMMSIGMSAQGMVGSGSSDEPNRRPLSVNERKKCFNKGSKNRRPNATDLYCSEECKIIARKNQLS